MNYHAYGFVLSSTLTLPELIPAHGAPPSISVTLDAGRAGDDDWQWVRPKPAIDRPPWLAVGRLDARHRLLFDGGTDFVVPDGEPAITAFGGGAVSQNAMRHRLLDQVIPFVLSHHFNRFVLHASAFVTPHGAAVLIGPAGAGKSTLSTSFGMNGAAVVTDDALVIEHNGRELWAVPAYPSVRVWPDVLPALGGGGRSASREASASPGSPDSKERLGREHGLAFAESASPIRRLYLLQAVDGVERPAIERLPPRDAIMALIGHTFVLDIENRRRLGEQFARVCEASIDADVRSLTYPPDLSALPRVREAILRDLSGR